MIDRKTPEMNLDSFLDLRRSDAGLYTCRSSSETGETTWSASLNVESALNPAVFFRRTPSMVNFPGAPSRPVISEVTETSMKITWKMGNNIGTAPVSSFMVQFFTFDGGEVRDFIISPTTAVLIAIFIS